MMDQAAELNLVDAIQSCEDDELDSPGQIDRRPAIPADLPLAFALDLLRMSVILTDSSGQILYANREARGLLKDQSCLRLSMGKLCAVNGKSALQLIQAIRRSTEGDAGSASPLGIAVPLIDADGRRLAAWVLPIAPGTDRWQMRRAAIFIRSSVDVLSDDMFASTYGATVAEIRVLKQLLKGLNIDEVSQALNLSRNTVRTHVKALFAKTGTTRQAELLRLATSCIGPASAMDARPEPRRFEPRQRRRA